MEPATGIRQAFSILVQVLVTQWLRSRKYGTNIFSVKTWTVGYPKTHVPPVLFGARAQEVPSHSVASGKLHFRDRKLKPNRASALHKTPNSGPCLGALLTNLVGEVLPSLDCHGCDSTVGQTTTHCPQRREETPGCGGFLRPHRTPSTSSDHSHFLCYLFEFLLFFPRSFFQGYFHFRLSVSPYHTNIPPLLFAVSCISLPPLQDPYEVARSTWTMCPTGVEVSDKEGLQSLASLSLIPVER